MAPKIKKKTICLNMIVKNESHVIERCLKSVKPLIDYWVIVDTGSSDGTQKIIKKFMKDIPGKLYERPWKDFAHNRNEALKLAKNKADYVLWMDADDALEYSEDFVLPNLTQDLYYIEHDYKGNRYLRDQLINNHLDWVWKGVLHEELTCKEIITRKVLPKIKNIDYIDGYRSQNPRKHLDDAKVLKEALKKEPKNTRYQFYLATSLHNAK